MELAQLRRLNELRQGRRAALTITEIATGRSEVYAEGETFPPELAQEADRVLRSGKSTLVNVGGKEYFLNVYLPATRIVVIGAVHISQAMAPMARAAGYALEIVDPRTAFASPERFPDVELHAQWPEEYLREHPLDAYCALAAVTHDPKIDDPALIAAIEAGCFYVGALGSRRTHERRRERLCSAGLPEPQFARIAAPIGLDIGAATPGEIAVAVLAQIIAAYRHRDLIGRHAGEEERILDA